MEKMDLPLLWKEITEIRAKDWKFSTSFAPNFRDYGQMVDYYSKPGEIIGKVCNDAFRMMMIKSDGSVIPAHGRCYQHTVGNIYQQSLPEIWNSQAFGSFRKDLMAGGGLFPGCARCCSAF